MSKTFIIAEVAQTHEGSLNQAFAFVDAVAKTGANAIKFQTHIADAESTPTEPFRIPFSHKDKTRYDYWRRMEFTRDEWAALKSHAEKLGLVFLSSPFSIQAVELLESIGIAGWKIGSGEVRSWGLLERAAKSKKPFYISTGMSSFTEISETVEFMKKLGANFSLFQCTTNYPCGPEKIGLNVLQELKQRFNCPVGLSDHSGTIYPSLAAATLGADLLEVHVTLSREMFGPDVSASVTTAELKTLVEGVRFIEAMRANPVDKDKMAQELDGLKKLFGKSAVTAKDLAAGEILLAEHLVFKKPGGGISESDLSRLVGKKLNRALPKDTLLEWKDLG